MPLNCLTLNSPSAAAIRSADEVEGPAAVGVSPKYLSEAPDKIIHEIITIFRNTAWKTLHRCMICICQVYVLFTQQFYLNMRITQLSDNKSKYDLRRHSLT